MLGGKEPTASFSVGTALNDFSADLWEAMETASCFDLRAIT
jgi:hypothetical protein